MAIELREDWNVREDDEAEVVVVAEGHVDLVGQRHGVHSRPKHVRQGQVDGHYLP